MPIGPKGFEHQLLVRPQFGRSADIWLALPLCGLPRTGRTEGGFGSTPPVVTQIKALVAAPTFSFGLAQGETRLLERLPGNLLIWAFCGDAIAHKNEPRERGSMPKPTVSDSCPSWAYFDPVSTMAD